MVVEALSPLAVDIDEKLDINQVFTCIDCGRKTEKVDPHIQSLTMTIPVDLRCPSTHY